MIAGKKAVFRAQVLWREPAMTTGADTETEPCELIRRMLARVGEKWPVLALDHLRAGPMRFNELRRAMTPVTQRMLSVSLRALEQDGLVTRTVHPTVPPQVEYALTEAGRDLHEVVRGFVGWADTYAGVVRESPAAVTAGPSTTA
jgi:DNA-binding HxlR family transcriptional regulator